MSLNERKRLGVVLISALLLLFVGLGVFSRLCLTLELREHGVSGDSRVSVWPAEDPDLESDKKEELGDSIVQDATESTEDITEDPFPPNPILISGEDDQPNPNTELSPSEEAPSQGGTPAIGTDARYQVISSISTWNRRYFPIDFGDVAIINPNIIPHPSLADTFVVIAQGIQRGFDGEFFELACDARFIDGTLRCVSLPKPLPVLPTPGGKCEGELDYYNLNVGPHDGRAFYGPTGAYVVFGSNSIHTCFGQHIQDLRSLLGWASDRKWTGNNFQTSTELQRPLPWNIVEKNWFLFWDSAGSLYAHFDLAPRRVFARIEPNGSSGPDLAPEYPSHDDDCLQKYLPTLESDQESLHQATNTLVVTTCRRSDPSCVVTIENTFIIAIVQHKTYYNFHSVYEPYVMVFRQDMPFELHGISRKPLWISGRQMRPESDTSDMFYITSISWKNSKRRYHGFMDDELLIGFGIEDERSGGIDVLAGDLLSGLGHCQDPL